MLAQIVQWWKRLWADPICPDCGSTDLVPDQVCDGKVWGYTCLNCMHYTRIEDMTQKTVVINVSDINAVRAAMDAGRYVYCGRGSAWGNYRYKITSEMDRDAAIANHRADLLHSVAGVKNVFENLRGKVLGCHCKPKACHCDTYADICNNPLKYGITPPTVVAAIEPYFRESGPAVIIASEGRECRLSNWSGVVDDQGQEIAFDPTLAVRLFMDRPQIAQQILATAEACGLATDKVLNTEGSQRFEFKVPARGEF